MNINLLKRINLIYILLIVITLPSLSTTNTPTQWLEIRSAKIGVQFVDVTSLEETSDKIIRFNSIFIPDTDSQMHSEKYIMTVDCTNDLYIDLSINGSNNLNKKWIDSKDDILLKKVISKSCDLYYN